LIVSFLRPHTYEGSVTLGFSSATDAGYSAVFLSLAALTIGIVILLHLYRKRVYNKSEYIPVRSIDHLEADKAAGTLSFQSFQLQPMVCRYENPTKNKENVATVANAKSYGAIVLEC